VEANPLDAALKGREPGESITAAAERWLLRNLRAYIAESGVPQFCGAVVESIDLVGSYPETRIAAKLRYQASRSGQTRLGGFTDDVWCVNEDGQPLSEDEAIAEFQTDPIEILFEGSVWATVNHLRGNDALIPRRIERDAATGETVEWIDYPISDLYASPEEAAQATWHWRSREQMTIQRIAIDADQVQLLVDGPWHRPATITCEHVGDKWRVVEKDW
jgi:hypothetical protein